jgi:cyclophilin family peptidyl-prolyl cis-trans isomerase
MRVPDDEPIARESFAALMAAGVVDAPLIEAALGEASAQLRRLGAFALFGTGATLSASDRTRLVRAALEDRDWTVRFDGLRAWIRRETETNGCGSIANALSDESQHLVLAAIDALGERCVAGEESEALTARLLSELRTPPDIGSWHREAHALVAAAKRAPERAAMALPAFRTHNLWQVRMYAARAAAAMKDPQSLERLAYDPHDNVREASLGPLRTLKEAESDAAIIAALGRADYQLLRTAALVLKGAQPDKYLTAALAGALERVTAEKKDTSRDTRLALLERLRAVSGREQRPLFERLLEDFDPAIAAAAADACSALSTRPCVARPHRLPRPQMPTPQELREPLKGVVALDNGRRFDMRFHRDVAPLAYTRFVRLARAKYYDGLTFHRVVPNFVIQGGSPGANEYVGDGPFMRDELGLSHRRGTVGISTRGRDTGDAQIFVNLVDNPRLDFEYTVFASVPDAQMSAVDTIQEGTRIRRIDLVRDR